MTLFDAMLRMAIALVVILADAASVVAGLVVTAGRNRTDSGPEPVEN